MTEWNAQIGKGEYSIQFKTSHYNLYKLVEKVCQKCMDRQEKYTLKARINENPFK